MPTFYLTFGSNSPYANTYREIMCEDRKRARELAFEEFGAKWAFIYDDEEFAGQPERYGLRRLLYLGPNNEVGSDYAPEDYVPEGAPAPTTGGTT